MPPSAQNQIRGYVDGYRDGRIYGWAWRPSAPQETLLIEVLVNGELVAETAAWIQRADLSEAGIGDGRHGFDVLVALDVNRLRDTRVVVRVKGGEALPGALVSEEPGAAGAPLDAAVAAFIDSILDPGSSKAHDKRLETRRRHGSSADAATPVARWQPRAGAVMNFIVYDPMATHQPVTGLHSTPGTRVDRLIARLLNRAPAPTGADASPGPQEGVRIRHLERVYSSVAPAFNALLARLGTVHVARDPLVDVNRIYDGCSARGESCLLLYYALPHQMILGSRCPVMPVIAWDYPDVPSETWDGDSRNDWRHVLVQTAGAITLSGTAAKAVRAAMGEHFPVLAVPSPVWDRSLASARRAFTPPRHGIQVELRDLVFDSRRHARALEDPLPQPPRREALGSTQITLEGVVFTAVAVPRDGIENWQEILTAFIAEFREDADAILVLKMIGSSLSDWWWELNDLLMRFPACRCRVLVMHDFDDDVPYAELIAITHWLVNASAGEAVCLPSLEFMSAGCPAVTPLHTAMADFIDTRNAIVVRSDDAFCGWPHDPDQHFTTVSQGIDWMSLREAMREAHQMTNSADGRYTAMSEAAMSTMRQFCGDTVVLSAFAEFLGLRTEISASTPQRVPA